MGPMTAQKPARPLAYTGANSFTSKCTWCGSQVEKGEGERYRNEDNGKWHVFHKVGCIHAAKEAYPVRFYHGTGDQTQSS